MLAVEKVWSSGLTQIRLSLVCCPAHSDGSLWVTMGVCSPGACTGPSTQGPHHYWGTWAQNYPSTEPGILLGRSSNHSVTSKGDFQASSDLECDQLNMKKCLIKLTWKSLEGSWKLKARLPVPHSIWQSSRSPLATNAGLSLQRDVQPFHFAGCHHGSRGINLGAAIPAATLWTGVCPSGDPVSPEEGKLGNTSHFSAVEAWLLGRGQHATGVSLAVKAWGAPYAMCHWDWSTLFLYQREFILDI